MTQNTVKLPGKQLAQLRPSSTVAVSLYSPPQQRRSEVRKIVIANTSNASQTYRIFHDNDGTTYDQTTSLCWDIPIGVGVTDTFTEEIWLADESGNLAVKTSTSNALTFTAYGSEEKR